MKQLQDLTVNAAAANASFNSNPIDVRQAFSFSAQAIGSAGSLSGTVQVQVSDTPVLDSFANYANANPTWSDLGDALTFDQESEASSQLIPKTDLCYVALRFVYTDSSSGDNTADISIQVSTLGV
jgi:hypothetical protein